MKEQLYQLNNQPTQDTEKPFMLPSNPPVVMTEEVVRQIQGETFNNFSDILNVVKGNVKSGNFITGVSGWQIDAAGNAEFNNGTFRGTFNIGGTVITISDVADLQSSINEIDAAGGGTVFLQPGTYTLTSDISIPGGVRVEGVSRDATILDCNGTYKVQMIGSSAYSTGTVALNDGDTTVVGTGTTWTAGMVGQFILLGKNGDFLWYEITARTDNTHITIGTPYTGTNLSGDTYTIATINTDAQIAKCTITGATGVGLKCQYAMEPIFDNIYVTDCGTGLDFDQVIFPLLNISANGNGVNWNANEVSGYEVKFSSFDDSTTGAGIIMTACGNATFFDSSIRGNAGDGVNMTNCELNTFLSVDAGDNGGQGIEFVAGCNNNQFIAVAATGNASDGYKLTATSDSNTISGGSRIENNGGYGINIAASTCDSNTIIGNSFSGNSSGAVSDSGTSTIIKSNSGVVDNTGNYSLMGGQPAQIPADATTYYFGAQGFVATTTANTLYRINIPKKGTVTAVYVNFVAGGTVASSETSTVYLRLNNTTDTTISSAVTNNSSIAVVSNTALSIPVVPGDYFEIKWITPTWVTNPGTAVVLQWTIYIE